MGSFGSHLALRSRSCAPNGEAGPALVRLDKVGAAVGWISGFLPLPYPEHGSQHALEPVHEACILELQQERRDLSSQDGVLATRAIGKRPIGGLSRGVGCHGRFLVATFAKVNSFQEWASANL